MTQVGRDRQLRAVGVESKANGIHRVMRDGERVNLDVTHGEVLTRPDLLHTPKALAQGIRERALQRFHGRRGHIQRCLPQAQHLRQPNAMIVVFVRDQDTVEVVYFFLDCRESGQGFAFAESGVNQEAGTLGLE